MKIENSKKSKRSETANQVRRRTPLARRVAVVVAALATSLATFVALVGANSLLAPSAGALAPRAASSSSDTFPCTEVNAPATDVCTYFHWGLETDPNVLGLFYVNGVLSETGQPFIEFPTCAQDSPSCPFSISPSTVNLGTGYFWEQATIVSNDGEKLVPSPPITVTNTSAEAATIQLVQECLPGGLFNECVSFPDGSNGCVGSGVTPTLQQRVYSSTLEPGQSCTFTSYIPIGSGSYPDLDADPDIWPSFYWTSPSSPNLQGVWIPMTGLSLSHNQDFGLRQTTYGCSALAPGTHAVALLPSPDDAGYWIVASNGDIFACGDATTSYGMPDQLPSGLHVTNAIENPTATGYSLAIASYAESPLSYSDSSYYAYTGSIPTVIEGTNFGADVTGVVGCIGPGIAVEDSTGYGAWGVSPWGAVVAVGDAPYFGEMQRCTNSDPTTGLLNLAPAAPIVGIAATPDNGGYWLAGADGGVVTFGDAGFYGSAGALHLVKPVVAIASTPDGKGYWLATADGGIFTFGDAGFYGSTGALHLAAPIMAMATTHDGKGYWLLAADGEVFTFGDAGFYGSAA